MKLRFANLTLLKFRVPIFMSKKLFQSDYIISLESNLKDSTIKDYIEKVVKEFLEDYGIYSFLYISPENQITHNDFKSIDFNYFYEKIMFDSIKENDLIDVKTKVCVTFDKRLCTTYNNHLDRYYNTLSIGGCDVVYYILFTLEEIYDEIYNED